MDNTCRNESELLISPKRSTCAYVIIRVNYLSATPTPTFRRAKQRFVSACTCSCSFTKKETSRTHFRGVFSADTPDSMAIATPSAVRDAVASLTSKHPHGLQLLCAQMLYFRVLFVCPPLGCRCHLWMSSVYHALVVLSAKIDPVRSRNKRFRSQ